MELKAKQCPKCGGDIKLDSTGIAGICLYCGSEIMLEASDNVASVNAKANLINLIKDEYERKNYQGVIEYSAKVLEMDSRCWQAIYYRGLGEVWQSTPDCLKFTNAIYGIRKAIELIQQSDLKNLPGYQHMMAVELHRCIIHFFNLCRAAYEKAFKLTSQPEDYWKQISILLSAIDYCLTLFSPQLMASDVTAKASKLAVLTTGTALCVEKCVYRKKKTGVTPDSKTGAYTDFFTVVSVQGEDRNLTVGKYDEYSALIRQLDAARPIAAINREPYKKKNGCYIATAVYGDYSAPEVMVLRRYRDEVLYRKSVGRLFIRIYYFLSPPIAKRLVNMKTLNGTVKKILNRIVDYIQRNNRRR